MDTFKKNRIVIVGSYNKDITIRTNKLPEKGETVLGELINSGPGGKGANQAVAAVRAGAEVCFITSVGMDDNGKDAIETLHKQGVEVRLIKKDKELQWELAQLESLGPNWREAMEQQAGEPMEGGDMGMGGGMGGSAIGGDVGNPPDFGPPADLGTSPGGELPPVEPAGAENAIPQ